MSVGEWREWVGLFHSVAPNRVTMQMRGMEPRELIYSLMDPTGGYVESQVPIEFKGSLEARVGPMYSGKSWWLIFKYRELHNAKRTVRAFKPGVDTRDEGIFSRGNGGTSVPCTLLNNENMASEIDRLLIDRVQAVVIDELHFLDNAYAFCYLLKALGICVYVAYLDGTFKQREFDNTKNLFSIINEYEKLPAICYDCPYGINQKACNTIKYKMDDGRHRDHLTSSMSDEDDRVPHVGGEEKYIAVCDRCLLQYKLGNRHYSSSSSRASGDEASDDSA